MIDNNIITIALILIFISLNHIFFSKKKKKSSHQWRLKSAKRTYDLIQTIKENGKVFSYLRKIDPFVFEEVLLIAFNKYKNVQTKRNEKYTGDGGIDGRFYYQGNLYLIQAKRYKNHINPAHVKEFSDVIEKEGAIGGFFIHTGRTGKSSKNIAFNSKNIKIISGAKLISLLRGNLNLKEIIP